MQKKIKTSVLGCAVVALTTGCAANLDQRITTQNQNLPDGAIAASLHSHPFTYGATGHVAARGADLQRTQLVRYASSPWIGGIQSVSKIEDKLPAIFNDNFVLDFGTSKVSLSVVAARLTRLTNIPVRVRMDESTQNGGGRASQGSSAGPRPAALPTPILQPGAPLPKLLNSGAAPELNAGLPASAVSAETEITVDAVNMKWNGRLRDFLDHLTNTLSLSWEYKDGAVVIMRLVSETYEVAAFPGVQNFAMSSGGSGTGKSGSSDAGMDSQNNTSVSQQGSMDVRQSLLKTVQELISKVPGSSVTWADGSGRMVVVTSKEAQASVREFLRKENKALRTMVNVTFDLYSVKTKDTDEKGVNWTSVFQSLNQKYGLTFSSPGLLTGATVGVLGGSATWGSGTTTTSAMLALLSQYGETSQHRPISITTLNGMWDTKSRVSTDGYLKETTPGLSSSSGAAGAPGLKTDTVTTGDQFAVLPYVQQDNNIILKYSINLSDLIGMFDVTTGSGETLQKVQTPKIEAVNASSTISLAPGQTAVITGLSRTIAKRDDSRLGQDIPVALGGSRKLEFQREHFLILVRATPL